jgi:hypothetical protein
VFFLSVIKHSSPLEGSGAVRFIGQPPVKDDIKQIIHIQLSHLKKLMADHSTNRLPRLTQNQPLGVRCSSLTLFRYLLGQNSPSIQYRICL